MRRTRIGIAIVLMLVGALLGRTTKADYRAWRALDYNQVTTFEGSLTNFRATNLTNGTDCVLAVNDLSTGQFAITTVPCR